MARKPKYDTEQVISFLEEYIKHYGMVIIKATDVARFCNEELGHKDITYQLFTRNNKKAKKWIDEYNEKLRERLEKKDIGNVMYSAQVDVDAFVKDYNLSIEAKNELLRMNRIIVSLEDEIGQMVEMYQTEKEEKESLLLKLEELTNRNKSLKEEIGSLQEVNSTITKQNREIKKYLKKNIYDPIMLAHFQVIGLINDDVKVSVPKINNNLISETDDLKETLDGYYEESDVVSKEMSEWMDKFEKL